MVANATAPSTSSSSASNLAGSQMIAQNFDQFLTLLTTQLKNQDPTSPMDSNQFTSQLVQFASVEQQIKQNDALSTLVTNTNSSNAIGALNFVGHYVTASGATNALTSGSASWVLNAAKAGTANITITDSNGNQVYATTATLTGGLQNFQWNGTSATGATLPDGEYTLKVQAQAVDQSPITVSTSIYGQVDGVDLTGTAPELKLGSLSIPLTAIQSIAN